METSEFLSLIFVVLGTNLIWYLKLRRVESEYKRVCGVYDKSISIRDNQINIYKSYLNDICSGSLEKEDEAKTAYRVSTGWQSSMGSDAWIKEQVHIFNKQMEEMVMAGTRPTIDEEKGK